MLVNNKILAIECLNEEQFRALEKYEGVFYEWKYYPECYLIPLGTSGNGINPEHESVKTYEYMILSFAVFSQLTGVTVPEKPKEVILDWGKDYKVHVTVNGIEFQFDSRPVNYVASRQEMIELAAAINSVCDGQ